MNTNKGINLVDMNFKKLSASDKRVAFVLMDVMLKKLHEKNLMVTDFNPSKISFQDDYYIFQDVVPITNYYADNKEEAIRRNILGLSNLAFCSYLPDYQLSNGLLSYEVISNHYDDFASIFMEQDRKYYKSILVDSYKSNKLPSEYIYYSDYVKTLKNDSSMDKGANLAYVKATEAGKLLTDKENKEAAFGNTFFFATATMSLFVLILGIILYVVYL